LALGFWNPRSLRFKSFFPFYPHYRSSLFRKTESEKLKLIKIEKNWNIFFREIEIKNRKKFSIFNDSLKEPICEELFYQAELYLSHEKESFILQPQLLDCQKSLCFKAIRRRKVSA
jgi:hypothetical protein